MIDERRLWTAVLLQAIKDLAGFTVVDNERDRARLQYFARLWFSSDNYEMGSFRWVCDQLELESSWLRHRMMTVIRSDHVGKESIGTFSAARLQSVFNGADEYTLQCASDLLSA